MSKLADALARVKELDDAEYRSLCPKLAKALEVAVDYMKSHCHCTDEQCNPCFEIDHIESILGSSDHVEV